MNLLIVVVTAAIKFVCYLFQVRVEVVLAPDAFAIQSFDPLANAKGYKLKLHSLQLRVPIRKLIQPLSLDLETRMGKKHIHYDLQRLEVKQVTIGPGMMSYTDNKIATSMVNPQNIMLLVIPEAYWSGTYLSNCLDLNTKIPATASVAESWIEDISITAGGTPLEVPYGNTKEEFQAQMFSQLFRHLGQSWGSRDAAFLGRRMFEGGYFMSLFDCTKARRSPENDARQMPVEGTLRLSIRFSSQLPQSVILFLFMNYTSRLTITKSRSCQYGYLAGPGT